MRWWAIFFLINWLIGGLFFVNNKTLAIPQFGGTVDTLTYCDCTDNWYVEVGDPQGGDFIKNSSTGIYDCEALAQGEWILGKSTEEIETCEIRVYNVCVEIASGEIIDYYGSSDNDCGSEASTDEYTPRDGTHDDKEPLDTTHDDKKPLDTTHDDKKDLGTTHKSSSAYDSGSRSSLGSLEFENANITTTSGGSNTNDSGSDSNSSSNYSFNNDSSDSSKAVGLGSSSSSDSTVSNSSDILSGMNNRDNLIEDNNIGIKTVVSSSVGIASGEIGQSGLETQLFTKGKVGQVENGMQIIQMGLVIIALSVSGYFTFKSVKKVFR